MLVISPLLQTIAWIHSVQQHGQCMVSVMHCNEHISIDHYTLPITLSHLPVYAR